ncbi:hypothetical protein LB456_03050 [Psychroflexus sp. CAK57W]|uniref:hypothetical protein n=1 Tax=Psychroflexus curvus TaxID=2873595 RepID=UPI001CCB846E|nr:hypothetical protein [Psychroflexus curvus]MBZ9786424.1 hypothetical protein [Psychroflexus curvus]
MNKAFSKHFEKIDDNIRSLINIKDSYTLENKASADVALFYNDECLAIGKYYKTLILPTDKNIRRYFHGDHDFMGSGTDSKLWFYFDDKNIIINDHNYVYPYDELMKDTEDFLNRLDFLLVK